MVLLEIMTIFWLFFSRKSERLLKKYCFENTKIKAFQISINIFFSKYNKLSPNPIKCLTSHIFEPFAV